MTANGLGKAKLRLSEGSTAMDIHDTILAQFPKLKACGGYELLRTSGGSKRLSVLTPPPEGYTGQFLKKVLSHANCYIRPLQHSINMVECPAATGVEIPDSVPRIKCETCAELIPLIVLREHIEDCQKEAEGPDIQITRVETNDSTVTESNDEVYYNDPITPTFSPLSTHEDDFLPPTFNFEPVIPSDTAGCSISKPTITSVTGIVKQIRSENGITVLDEEVMADCSSDQKLYVDVRRDFFLKDALRECKKKKFDPKKLLRVSFVGEDAIDTGGPRREFWELIISKGVQEYCIGEMNMVTFNQNTAAIQRLDLKHLGVYAAMSIVQGGRGFPVLHPCVYAYIWSGKYVGGHMTDEAIMQTSIKRLVQELRKCENDESVGHLFEACGEYSDILYETGYNKNLKQLGMRDVTEIVDILKCHSIKMAIPEINQFSEGLETLGILSYIKKYPDVMMDVFVDNGQRLTCGQFRKLFRVDFSEKATLQRALEEATYLNFVDFIEKCEEGDVDVSISTLYSSKSKSERVSLEDILSFCTGISAVPVGGFENTPSITFLHGEEHGLATASTCCLQLRLPTKYAENQELFEERLILSLKGHAGFGVH